MSTLVEKPENAPEHCPGTQSENAGKASACAGCPNQQICASGPKGPDPGIQLVKERLEQVKNKILVLSGKGGVGKSTVTALLGRALAASNSERNVAVLDIDICGPSQPRVLGVLDEQVHQSGSGWSPVYVDDNLSVMSIGFLLASPDDAIIWRGPKKNGMIRQFLSEVDWGKLDYLLMDTPPGTSDEHLSAATYLSQADLTGAIIVTTPQEVALLDVRKEIDFCRKVKIDILGVIENMSVFVCPCCRKLSEIFPATTGGAKQMCADLDVPFLGSLPLDPKIARCCDEGKDFVTELPDSAAVKALNDITKGKLCNEEVVLGAISNIANTPKPRNALNLNNYRENIMGISGCELQLARQSNDRANEYFTVWRKDSNAELVNICDLKRNS